jgi:hypothetical protein
VQDKLRSFAQVASQDVKEATVVGNMQLELSRAHDSVFSTLAYTCTDHVYKDHAGVTHAIHICVHEEVEVASEPETSESLPKFIAHAKSGAFNRVDIKLRAHNSTGAAKTVASLQMRRGAMNMLGSKRKRPNILFELGEQ